MISPFSPQGIEKAERDRVARLRNTAKRRPHLTISSGKPRFGSTFRLTQIRGYSNPIVLGEVIARRIKSCCLAELNQKPVKQLVRDGVWQVPPADRPQGWELMGAREA